MVRLQGHPASSVLVADTRGMKFQKVKMFPKEGKSMRTRSSRREAAVMGGRGLVKKGVPDGC